MARHNLGERAKAVLFQNRTTTTATSANTTGQDALGFDQALFLFLPDTIASGASVTVAKLQDSADNSAWSDIAGANFLALNATLDSTEDVKVYVGSVNLNKAKRYIRFSITADTGAVSWSLVALASSISTPPGQTEGMIFQV